MVSTDRMIMNYRGKSSDTKPDAPNGSDFLEINTGKTWYYDADSGEWIDPTASNDDTPAG